MVPFMCNRPSCFLMMVFSKKIFSSGKTNWLNIISVHAIARVIQLYEPSSKTEYNEKIQKD